jgi:DNA-binding response OmpR family regulator
MKTMTPDIVALDRFIDNEDSLFYIQELKESGYKGPILVISVVDDLQGAIQGGADAFLAKPASPFKLASTLRGLLEGRVFNTILLADDDEVSRYLLGEALSKMGYSILEAQNGREAVRIVEEYKLGGVFLDLVMPDSNRLSKFYARSGKTQSTTKTMPIIIHSSKDLTRRESGTS